MSMTKKDFVSVAEVIAQAAPASASQRGTTEGVYAQAWASGCDSAREYIARGLADYCATTNRKFDRARFLAACGVSQ